MQTLFHAVVEKLSRKKFLKRFVVEGIIGIYAKDR
jgi:hypothetical protein